MKDLLELLETEHSLVLRRQKNFDERVRLLYKLDECKMSKEEQEETEMKVRYSSELEATLTDEIKQTRTSIKRYILRLLDT